MSSHRPRSGEQGKFPFRSERICFENGKWYFNTREGTLVGPFRDEAETRKALAVFVAERIRESGVQQFESGDHKVDAEAGFHHMVEELLGFFRLRSESGEAAACTWAHSRIAELKANREGSAALQERIDILLYAMSQNQHFAYR
jgi:hypothetical protein